MSSAKSALRGHHESPSTLYYDLDFGRLVLASHPLRAILTQADA